MDVPVVVICAIMQPTFLPWAGYFNLISRVDTFVFLDNVQYQKCSWHSRNRLLVKRRPHWLTVPVRHVELDQTIQNTRIEESRGWRTKHVRLLTQSYAKHPHAQDVMEICAILQDTSMEHLADLNIHLVRWFCAKLDLAPRFYRSSALEIDSGGTGPCKRLASILAHVGAKAYISPRGAAGYLAEDRFVEWTTTSLQFQNYTPRRYPQHRHAEFVSHLSIFDVVANLGWTGTKQYIAEGSAHAVSGSSGRAHECSEAH
jgi:hypothetical protein